MAAVIWLHLVEKESLERIFSLNNVLTHSEKESGGSIKSLFHFTLGSIWLSKYKIYGLSKCHEKKILYFYQMPTSKYILWTIKYSHSVINEYLTAAAVVLARENWCYKTSTISLYSAPAPNYYLFTSNLLLWSFVAFIYVANI